MHHEKMMHQTGDRQFILIIISLEMYDHKTSFQHLNIAVQCEIHRIHKFKSQFSAIIDTY